MNIIKSDEFIDLYKKGISVYKHHYCEIIILNSGSIMLLDGSHLTTVFKYLISKGLYNNTNEINKEIPIHCSPLNYLIDKYMLCSVHDSSYIIASKNINRMQKRTIDKLFLNGILDDMYIIRTTDEFTKAKREHNL